MPTFSKLSAVSRTDIFIAGITLSCPPPRFPVRNQYFVALSDGFVIAAPDAHAQLTASGSSLFKNGIRLYLDATVVIDKALEIFTVVKHLLFDIMPRFHTASFPYRDASIYDVLN